jgi:hypothetical protein
MIELLILALVVGICVFPLWKAAVRNRGPGNWLERLVFRKIKVADTQATSPEEQAESSPEDKSGK